MAREAGQGFDRLVGGLAGTAEIGVEGCVVGGVGDGGGDEGNRLVRSTALRDEHAAQVQRIGLTRGGGQGASVECLGRGQRALLVQGDRLGEQGGRFFGHWVRSGGYAGSPCGGGRFKCCRWGGGAGAGLKGLIWGDAEGASGLVLLPAHGSRDQFREIRKGSRAKQNGGTPIVIVLWVYGVAARGLRGPAAERGGAVDERGRVLGWAGRVAWGPAPADGEGGRVGAEGKSILPRMNANERG
jgi:hypothetical protein